LGAGRPCWTLAVPVPRGPEKRVDTSAAVVALFQQLHDEIRDLVRSVDHAALNFIPCPNANSIATIVTHVLGSEAETIGTIAGLQIERDRDAEFHRGDQRRESLLRQVDEADAALTALQPRLTAERLASVVSLPTLGPAEGRPGVTWIIGNLGHAREHMGHATLTRQLSECRSQPI